MPFCARIASTVSPNDMPRGISSRRKRPITSPWSVGLDLLAGDDDQLAAARLLDRLERAAEDVVVGDGDRAEPCASAWSSSSSTSIEQSCDQLVCMWRSARIQSRLRRRPGGRRAAARGELLVDRLDAVARARRSLRPGCGAALPRCGARGSATSSTRRAASAAASSGCARAPAARRSRSRRCASGEERAGPSSGGDEDRRRAQELRARGAVGAVRTRTRPRSRARSGGPRR